METTREISVGQVVKSKAGETEIGFYCCKFLMINMS